MAARVNGGSLRTFPWWRWAVSVTMTAAACLTAVELSLGVGEWWRARAARVGGIARLSAYAPFTRQYLHPFYYFFFTQDPAQLQRMNNAIVSVDAHGYRGPGPERRGRRKLAFLLGGSAAFGYGSSSDATTISGYLNQLQDDYHVVNAGVPSWSSTQEFARLAHQLLQERPQVVIVYDGFNDAIVSYHYARLGKQYPSGTPESYEYLEEQVHDIRAQHLVRVDLRRLRQAMFPRIRKALRAMLRADGSLAHAAHAGSPGSAPSDALVATAREAALAYRRNVDLMSRLSSASGIRLIACWQPTLLQHHHLTTEAERLMPAEAGDGAFTAFLREFHRAAMAAPRDGVALVDLSDLFDRHERMPFLDQVHLSDDGNELVARELLRYLRGEGS